ncbi:MAG: ferrous iron transport protein A [Spirochaetia bacterium]
MNCQAVNNKVQSLSNLTSGESALVVTVDGGKGSRQKLFDLGIVPGKVISVVQGAKRHPYIVRVGETKIMLGWGMVEKIYVTASKE